MGRLPSKVNNSAKRTTVSTELSKLPRQCCCHQSPNRSTMQSAVNFEVTNASESWWYWGRKIPNGVTVAIAMGLNDLGHKLAALYPFQTGRCGFQQRLDAIGQHQRGNIRHLS
jgi:hypothetical protein